MSRTPIPDAIRTREDLMALLDATTNYEERWPREPADRLFKLERVERLLAAAGDPQFGPQVVHIAGSKGKGTVARLVADALVRTGGIGPVGLFTSPHLQDLSERIQIDGRPAPDTSLCRAAASLCPYLRETHDTPAGPTFFELFTAIAWLVFKEAGCTHVVLETGLGGRLDATTVCRPAVTVITSIELEHTHILGDTVEAIAAEKAGILKPGVPAITTAAGAALDVIRQTSAEIGAELTVIGQDVELREVVSAPGPRLAFTLVQARQAHALAVPLAGQHHAANVAAAFLVLRVFRPEADPLALTHALGQAQIAGLLEPVARDPLVLIDGAHTPRSATVTRAALADAYPNRPYGLILAALGEKDVAGIAAALVPDAEFVVTTPVDTPRAVPADVLAERLRTLANGPIHIASGPAEALARARTLATEDTLLLATGSVYLAGAIRDAVGLAPGQFLEAKP